MSVLAGYMVYTATKIPFIYPFLGIALRGLISNFHIHVSVSDLYIPRIGPHISCSKIGRPIAHRHMNVEIGTVAVQFLFREYLFQIFSICSLQCRGQVGNVNYKYKVREVKVYSQSTDSATLTIEITQVMKCRCSNLVGYHTW
jgi:hypothetical protein